MLRKWKNPVTSEEDAGKYLREYKVLKPKKAKLIYEPFLLLILLLFDEQLKRYTREVKIFELKFTVFQK
jgi:hypothetical protein